MGGGVRRVVSLTLGWEDLPKSVSVEGASQQERLREPVPGVADIHAVAVSQRRTAAIAWFPATIRWPGPHSPLSPPPRGLRGP